MLVTILKRDYENRPQSWGCFHDRQVFAIKPGDTQSQKGSRPRCCFRLRPHPKHFMLRGALAEPFRALLSKFAEHPSQLAAITVDEETDRTSWCHREARRCSADTVITQGPRSHSHYMQARENHVASPEASSPKNAETGAACRGKQRCIPPTLMTSVSSYVECCSNQSARSEH